MGSRIKENPDKIFEGFFQVAAPEDDKSAPHIVLRYPADFTDSVIEKELPKFCFPCDLSTFAQQEEPIWSHLESRYNPAGQLFTFVLTNIDNTQRFGFCRHPPGARTCLCFLSYLPWFEIFYKILNTLAELNHNNEHDLALKIIKELFNTEIPEPKKLLSISVTDSGKLTEMHFSTPDLKSLPRIPESRNFMEFFSAVNPTNMMILFVSLLYERRVLITSEKLSRLTACVHGAASLLYPLYWQHIYTPVLPAHLIDYCCAPMPFLVGVHSSFMKKVRSMPLDEVIILNVDTNAIEAPFDDVDELPPEAIRELKKNLKNNSVSVGDGVPRSFLKALVYLIGSYKEGLTVINVNGENKIVFDRERFVQSRSSNFQPFLERCLTLQHFERFVDTRLERINSRKSYPNDVFEQQLEIEKQDGGCLSSKNKLQRHLEGGKESFLKAGKIIQTKAKQGMIQAQGSIRANPDAIKAKLKDVSEQVSSFSHQVSQQVKADDMKATLQKGLNKTKDIGRVGIAGMKTATKHVRTRVKGSKDAEDIDTRSKMTLYGYHDIDISNPSELVYTSRGGSVPTSPAESPVAVRHSAANLRQGVPSKNQGVPRPLTEMFGPSTGVRQYKTINLKMPAKDSHSPQTSAMDLMNDPDLKQVIAKLANERERAPAVSQEKDPAPIPPPRRPRPRKTVVRHSNSNNSTPVLAPPAPSARSRRTQEGQLINISELPLANQQPSKLVRTFPSPSSANIAPDDGAPLISVSESLESLTKSPSASNLFGLGIHADDSSNEQVESSSHLSAVKSLKGSRSSPSLRSGQFADKNLAQHEADTSQNEALIDDFSSLKVFSGCQSASQPTVSSQQSMFSVPFNPVVSTTAQVQNTQTPNLSSKVAPSVPNKNPFADSFVPPTSSYKASNGTPSSGAFSFNTTTTASGMQPSHPAYVSQVPLQPTAVQQKQTLLALAKDEPKDPFADLVSMQLKATSPTWKK